MFKNTLRNIGNVKDVVSTKMGEAKYAVSMSKVPTSFDEVLSVKDKGVKKIKSIRK